MTARPLTFKRALRFVENVDFYTVNGLEHSLQAGTRALRAWIVEHHTGFDPSYQSLPLEELEPLLRQVFVSSERSPFELVNREP